MKHTLTDELAIERTRLANERTLLAYIRTSLAVIAGGFALMHLAPGAMGPYGGWLMMLAGGTILVIGVWRFGKARRELAELAARQSGL